LQSQEFGGSRAHGAIASVEQLAHAITRSRRVATLAAALTRITLIPELAVAASVVATLFLKIYLMQPAASGPIRFAVIQHDAEIFALGSLFYSAAISLQRLHGNKKWKSLTASVAAEFCFGLCLVLVALYLADVLVYRFFVTRLYASDVVTFSSEMHAGLTLSRSGLKSVLHHEIWKLAMLGCVTALLVRGFFILLVRGVEAPGKRSLVGAGSAVFWTLVWLVPISSHFYSFDDKPLYENVLERNRNYFVHSNFSNDFRAKVLATPEPVVCSNTPRHRVNVVLLLVESLSAYQSNYFSGIENWTPQLDDIARNETALTNFHANGWTTIGGLVSLLTGTVPLVPEHTTFNRWGSPRLPDFAGVTPSLPVALEKQGYNTEFIGAGDLDFTGQDTWLHEIGFQKMVGGTDPRFAGQKIRGPFNSVPDHLLYDVALDELHGMPTDQPYFAVVQTFWTHRPFIDETGKQLDGEELVFREADAQIGNLYRRLLAEHFFDNGLLVIVGDHRAPLPFKKAEFKRFGASATARIPAVVVTRAFKLPHVISEDFQQRDFMASVVATVSGKSCLRPEEGNFLSSPPQPPACILHAQGSDRDLVLVTCGSSEGLVRVAGDRTRFVEGEVPDEATILQAINRTRARP
jgi:phosphoglycerol transferase MdoB-like AlkP superfamily enzyme